MGRKRFVIAIGVVAFVVTSIIAVMFQLGVDEQVIQNLLPRFEKRLGVKITYREAVASLTGLSMEGVEIRKASGPGMYARIDNLGISVRVGPLFVGEVDVTGVIVDGLTLPIGPAAGGVELKDWVELARRFSGGVSKSDHSDDSKRPELHLVSGNVLLHLGNFSGAIRGISGMVGDQGKAAFEAEEYEILHQRQVVFGGQSGELFYDPSTSIADIKAKGPEFEIEIGRNSLTSLFKDAKEAMSLIKKVTDSGESIGGQPDGEGLPQLDGKGITISVSEASGRLTRKEDGKELPITAVTVSLHKRASKALSIRASGQLQGTKSLWIVSGLLSDSAEPKFTVEVPSMPVKDLGGFLIDADYVDWSEAFADLKLDVELLGDQQEVSVSGSASVTDLVLKHDRLAKSPLRNLGAQAEFNLNYNWNDEVIHIERLMLSRRLARASLRGDVRLDRNAFDLFVDVPVTPCGNILSAIPQELRERLGPVELGGQFSLGMRLAIDEEVPDDTILEAALDNRCRITASGSVPDPGYFKGPFSYVAYTESGGDLRLVTGFGTERWVPLQAVSPYVIEAVLTTEDGKFWHHEGITLPEVRRAIALNLQKDNFRHGASTITMQLAKNLFLTRDRTIARKLQELFFVWYLETYFKKEEILELYLNVIEFGPSIYGLLDASEHYFGRQPEELNALESVFLVRLLPSPVKKYRYYNNGSDENLTKSLQRVLKRMFERKRITKYELAEALTQELVFHKEGDPLPEPRPPVRRYESTDTDFADEFAGDGVEDTMDENWDDTQVENSLEH